MNTGITKDGSSIVISTPPPVTTFKLESPTEQTWAPLHHACDKGVSEMPVGWEIRNGRNEEGKFIFFYCNHVDRKMIRIQDAPDWVVEWDRISDEYYYFNTRTGKKVYIVPYGWERHISITQNKPYYCYPAGKTFWKLEDVYTYLGYRYGK